MTLSLLSSPITSHPIAPYGYFPSHSLFLFFSPLLFQINFIYKHIFLSPTHPPILNPTQTLAPLISTGGFPIVCPAGGDGLNSKNKQSHAGFLSPPFFSFCSSGLAGGREQQTGPHMGWANTHNCIRSPSWKHVMPPKSCCLKKPNK